MLSITELVQLWKARDFGLLYKEQLKLQKSIYLEKSENL